MTSPPPRQWPMQTPLRQSVSTKHSLPLPHGAQPPPPQSTSVSPLFAIPSVQVGAQIPPRQTLPTQSKSEEQPCPVLQRGHWAPPQSTSVSRPSLMPFPHVSTWHVLPMHTAAPEQS